MGFPAVIVEVAFSAGASTGTLLHLDDAARGKLDTGTLATDITWTDVTHYVLGLSFNRGASRVEKPIIRYDAGTATIVFDNADRRFDPANLAGPYVAAGLTQVTPMRAMRIRATWAGITYDLFRGFADEWRIKDFPPAYATVTLTASDALKVLANNTRLAGSAVGASENSGVRINRILDSAGWAAIDRQVSTGDSTLQATTLAGDTLAELRLVADTEAGEFYIDGAGRVFFRNRQAIMTDSRSNLAQATFGDGGGAELVYEDVDVAYDDLTVANRVRITRVGGTQQTADDAASQSLNLIRTYERTDLIMETDPVASDHANYILRLAKDPELRFATLMIWPHADETNLFPQVLSRQIGDRLTIIRRPPGTSITRDVFVRGISHSIDVENLKWQTAFTLESATRYTFFVLDHATLGVLDTDALGY